MSKAVPVYTISAFAIMLIFTTAFISISKVSTAHGEENSAEYYVDANMTVPAWSEIRDTLMLDEVPTDVVYAESKQAKISLDSEGSPFVEYHIEEPLVSTIKETVVVKEEKRANVEIAIKFTQRGEFSEDDVFVLEKIVQAEAGGEPYKGKLSVANVILNRQAKFGGTIRDIVFANKQFSPVGNGTFDKAEPSADTIKAVQSALDGQDNSNGCLYFVNEKTATSKWVSKNRSYSHIISNHTFFK